LAGHGTRVYVVDADGAIRESIAALLDSAGIASRLFPSAAALLDAFDPADAGCVTADYGGAGDPGAQILAALRGPGHAVSVILFSVRHDAEMKRRAEKAGAAALLAKPADPGEFVQLVRRLLETRAATRPSDPS
jgi:FixJ family two-component response regulator